MKAISFCPPWPQAILDLIKDVEVRSWRPRENLLPLPVYLHASQREGDPGLLPSYWLSENKPFKGGVILGTASITYVIQYNELKHFREDLPRHWNPLEWFRPSVFGWVFEDVIKLKDPIKCKGHLRFFDVDLGDQERVEQ